MIERYYSIKLEDYYYRSEREECVRRECNELLEATIDLDHKENELDRKVDEMTLKELCSDANASLVE